MKPRLLLVTLLVLSSAVVALASPQMGDILVYEGKEYPIDSYLLEDYFNKFPKRRPKPGKWCSGLHRGYQAAFVVVDGNIYLEDVHKDVCSDSKTSVLKKVIPSGKKLFTDWTSDLIISGYGRNDEDPYMGDEPFNSSYEKYALFEIDAGRLTDVRHFDNKGFRQFRKKQFEAYVTTNSYELEVKRYMEESPKASRSLIDRWIETGVFSLTKKILVQ